MPSEAWKPWMTEEIETLLESELRLFTSAQRTRFGAISVPPHTVAASDGPGADGVSYWVIAQEGESVVYWDSIEEKFGIGWQRSDVLSDYGTYGERLAWALDKLSSEQARRPSG